MVACQKDQRGLKELLVNVSPLRRSERLVTRAPYLRSWRSATRSGGIATGPSDRLLSGGTGRSRDTRFSNGVRGPPGAVWHSQGDVMEHPFKTSFKIVI